MNLAPSRLKQAQELFELLVAASEQERAHWSASGSDEDVELRSLVERLLKYDESGMAGFLSEPAGVVATPRSPTDELAVPAQIGTFRILRRVSAGGMGVVYEALQANPHRRVALKVIRGGRFVDDYSIRLFQRETQALARLRHPCIGAIYEAGRTDDGQHFFAMEFVDGRTLTQYARDEGIGPRARLELFHQVCDAIHYAHQRGVMHRDLKPTNILVDEEGVPRVLDFGLARIADPDLGLAAPGTMPGLILGTLSYMSPEQARGESDEIDTRSDVFSLGVILYELLTDHLPFDVTGLPLPKAVEIICSVPPRSSPRLRGDLETITRKAIEKERSRRYSSAAALADDVARFLSSEPIIARPASVLYRLGKFVTRHRVPVALTASLFLAFAALAVTSTVQAARLTRRQQELIHAEQRATHRFNQVRDLAGSFLFEFHDAIARLPGSTAARRMLVTTALEYLDGLAAETGADRELIFELALAYQRVGQVQHSIRSPHVGDTEGALRSQTRALELLDGLASDETEEPRIPEHRALSVQYIAELGRVDRDRESDFDRVIGMFESLVRRYPEEPRYRRRVIQASLGKFYGLQGNSVLEPRHVLAELEATRRLIDASLEWDPSDIEARKNLASFHDAMGDLLTSATGRNELSDDRASLEHYEAALAIERELLSVHPHDAFIRRGVSARLGKTALPLHRVGRSDEAIHRLRDAADRFRTICDADPDDALARRDLRAMLQRLGDISAQSKRDEDALAAYVMAAAIGRELFDHEPANARHALVLGTLWQQMAGLHSRRSEWGAAIECCNQAMALWQSDSVILLLDAMPHGKVVEGAIQRLVAAHEALGEHEAALAEHQRAVELFERVLLLKGGALQDTGQSRLNLAAACERLGDAIAAEISRSGSMNDELDALRARSIEAWLRGIEVLADPASAKDEPPFSGLRERLQAKSLS